MTTRQEHDLLGDRAVDDSVYYGIQTLRAKEVYQVTDIPISHFPNLPKALGMVKKAAAMANMELGLIPQAHYPPCLLAPVYTSLGRTMWSPPACARVCAALW